MLFRSSNSPESLANLRDSGELDDKANVGLVIDRPRDDDGERTPNTDLKIVKCNAGQEGVVRMVFRGDRLTFSQAAVERL